MKLLDKIALNNLLKIVANFIISILKIFNTKNVIDNPVSKPKRPIVDKLRNIFKK